MEVKKQEMRPAQSQNQLICLRSVSTSGRRYNVCWWFPCPMRYQGRCMAWIWIMEGLGWVQLDWCCKHDVNSHDRFKYLTYTQLLQNRTHWPLHPGRQRFSVNSLGAQSHGLCWSISPKSTEDSDEFIYQHTQGIAGSGHALVWYSHLPWPQLQVFLASSGVQFIRECWEILVPNWIWYVSEHLVLLFLGLCNRFQRSYELLSAGRSVIPAAVSW